jgi:hypothetical protein
MTRKLSSRQLAVIDEVFRGEVDEQSILDKYKVSRKLYNRWLADETFAAEFDRQIESAFRQSVILIARYAPVAAAKLVSLMDSDKEETARKACLDIISSAFRPKTQDPGLKTQDNEPLATSDKLPGGLSDHLASRLLSILAEADIGKTQDAQDV